MNHGQIEVPELLQVQREAGRGLEASGGVEGQRGKTRGGGVSSFAFCSCSFSHISFFSTLFKYACYVPTNFPRPTNDVKNNFYAGS